LTVLAGTELLSTFEQPTYLYVVLDGDIALRTPSGGLEHVGAGGWFGSPLLGRAPRIGEAVATTNSTIACTHELALKMMRESASMAH
jgi:hypothetical protein